MKRYQFIASDFEGDYKNVDDCALARLFKREHLYEKFGRVMFSGWGEMQLGEDRVPYVATNVLLNNKPIEGFSMPYAKPRMDSNAFRRIKIAIQRGVFKSASFELVKNVVRH